MTIRNSGATDWLSLAARSRCERAPGSGAFRACYYEMRWNPSQTAVLICDMWDRHWCAAAARRVDLLAPAMESVVAALRDRGALVIHSPSDTMAAYKESPQRLRAIECVTSPAPPESERWNHLDSQREAPLPIDDSDGGCDDVTVCAVWEAWTRQHPAITVAAEDVVSDSGHEIIELLRAGGISQVIVMGVHTNMCVLGRPFSIRRLVRLGFQVVLMRDMTDTMYNPRMHPFVTHAAGTRLVIEHVEKYWCPTITSSSLTGEPPFRFPAALLPDPRLRR